MKKHIIDFLKTYFKSGFDLEKTLNKLKQRAEYSKSLCLYYFKKAVFVIKTVMGIRSAIAILTCITGFIGFMNDWFGWIF